jgi:hypothetical protein
MDMAYNLNIINIHIDDETETHHMKPKIFKPS